MRNIIIIVIMTFCILLLLDSGSSQVYVQAERKEKPPTLNGQLSGNKNRLRVATTTSLYDTGLWQYLEPVFEAKNDVELDIVSVGTGIALEYGRRGDVDVIAVHSKARELKFVEDGYGIKRVPFMYNYFLIVGPDADPAGIRGKSPEEAFRKLASIRTAVFISRGDDSGTHGREKAIWKSAGFADYDSVPRTGDWYTETGRGMGPTLLMASEKQAYTLTDTGTFLAYRGKIELVPLVESGRSLLNVYSVIACNPEKNRGVNSDLAKRLVGFLVSREVQELIRDFGTDQYGVPLFFPCAGAEPGDDRTPDARQP